jgi:hypothetical protein
MTQLCVGSGCSSLDEATAAGTEAARAALAGLEGASPGLVIVYASIRYDLTELLAAVRSVAGDTPLIGASSSGQFANGEFLPAGASVSVMILGAGVYRFGTAAVTGIGTDTVAAGRELARRAVDAGGAPAPYSALLVLADGMAGDMQGLLTGIYRVTGALVPVVGGAAGDDRTFAGSSVMHDGEALPDAAVAVWIGSDRPLHVVAAHGWQPQTPPMLLTQVDGTAVLEIAGRPAVEVYNEAVGKDTRTGIQQIEGASHGGWYTATAFGLIEPDGTQLVRGAYIGEDGLLHTFTPLPEYGAVQVVSADQDDLLDISDQVVGDALRGVPDPAVMLMFSCIARTDILGDRAAEEAARLHKAAGSVATFGFYTYGEFARTTGVAGYHNATITAIAL